MSYPPPGPRHQVQLRALNFAPRHALAQSTALFELAKNLGVETIIVTAVPSDLAALDSLATEFAINVALPSHEPKLLAPYSNRIGIALDLANPRLPNTDRALAIHLQPKAITPTLFRDLYRLDLKLILTLDPASLDAFEQALHPIMTERVAAIARTMPIRDPAGSPHQRAHQKPPSPPPPPPNQRAASSWSSI